MSQQHTLIRAGAGVGLLAASLGAAAQDLSSFARPMAFMRIEAGKTSYAAFLPWYTANVNAGPVIYLDLGNSGTASTWAFGVANAASSDTVSWAGSHGVWPATGSMTYWHPILGTTASHTGNMSFFGGDVATKSLTDIQYSTLHSSVSCNVTMNAAIDTDGFLKWGAIKVQPSKFSSWYTQLANSTYALIVTSGVSNGSSTLSLTTFASSDLTAITADKSLPTFSHTRIYHSNAAGISTLTNYTDFSTYSSVAANYKTINATVVKQWNTCLAVYQGRNAQNQPSAALGGKSGFMRIW